MELYHHNTSVCAQKVRLAVAEKGLTPVLHYVDIMAGEQFKPEYLKLNPKHVVPTLVDQGRPIVESSIICEYLDEAYPQVPLRPADAVGRAQMRQWTQMPDAFIHTACTRVSFGIAFRHIRLAMPKDALEAQLARIPEPVARAVMRRVIFDGLGAPEVGEAVRHYATMLAHMEARLAATAWLAGAAYTLADGALLPYVERLADLQLDFLWDDKPKVADWLARSRARPNYSAISAFIDAPLKTLLAEQGAKAALQVRTLLAGS